MGQIIRCVNCDQVFHRTAFDQHPEYISSPASPDGYLCIESDDYNHFLESHQGHRLEDLKIIEDSFVSEKPYSEPVKVSYFKVTNGKEKFVVRKFRKDIHDPLTYDLIYGDVSLKCVKVEVQTAEIRKQMEIELAGAGLSNEQMDAFVQLIQALVDKLDVRNLTRVSDDSSHPLEIYYQMDDITYVSLLRNCHKIFKGAEFPAVQEFVDRHRDDGVLLLKVTHKIQLTETVKMEKKLHSVEKPIDQKVVVKKE